LSDVIVEMGRCGLEVVDIENLRRHYALTRDAWAERFEEEWKMIHALDPQRFDERFYRVWRTYLLGCAEMFRSSAGYTHLFQIASIIARLASEDGGMKTDLDERSAHWFLHSTRIMSRLPGNSS